MFHLNSWAPTVRRKAKGESASHRAAAGGIVSYSEPRNVEGEIEPNDCRSQFISELEKDVLYEILFRQKFEPVFSCISGYHLLLAFAQGRGVVEQAVPFQFTGSSPLKGTKPEPLGWVGRGLRIKNQIPFGGDR